MKMLKYLLSLSVMFVTLQQIQAQDAGTTVAYPVADTTALVAEEEPAFTITGAVDAYYMFGFNGTGLNTSFTDATDAFALGMGNVIFSKEGKVGFVADLAFGPRAEAANGTGEGPTLSAIKQLFVTFSPSEAVTFTLGNFGTFVGYELIDATGNINYSTSYLFSNGPFFHTGLKANFTISENFGAMLGVFNDTDRKLDPVPGKHLGAQLSTQVGGLSAYLNFLYGKDANFDDDKMDVDEYELDLTASYAVSEKFSLGLNIATYNTSVDGTDTGGFTGGALYATITTSEKFALGLRAEHFIPDDGDDATDDTGITALTASGNITFGNLRLIPEIRIDFAGEDIFLTDEEKLTGSNGGIILAAVYSF